MLEHRTLIILFMGGAAWLLLSAGVKYVWKPKYKSWNWHPKAALLETLLAADLILMAAMLYAVDRNAPLWAAICFCVVGIPLLILIFKTVFSKN